MDKIEIGYLEFTGEDIKGREREIEKKERGGGGRE